MTIRECLEQLPKDMVMIDLTSFYWEENHITTVENLLKTRGMHLEEEGYEIQEFKTNYGRTTKRQISHIGNEIVTIYREK